jgi:RimJ/RimL family protein N-acetyltransferase
VKRVRIEGERLTLRPLRLDELDAVVASRPPARADREQLRARIERSGLMADRRIDLAIDIDGVRVGEIQTYVPEGRALPPGAFELGVTIDDPSLRGRGYGSEAVQLFADWLFEHRDATRVSLGTVESNIAMRTVAERLGFVADGVVTDHGTEYVFYVLTRDAWQARRRSR